MNATRLIVLALALVAAGAAAYLVRGLVLEGNKQVAGPAEPVIPTVDVLVASSVLTPGHTLRGGDMRWQTWPESALAEGQVTRGSAPSARDDFQGSMVRRAFAVGEPIVSSAVVRPGDAGLMAALVSPGMRAMSVPVSDETSAGGFILPGDRVDVLLTREVGEDRRDSSYVSETILSNLRVLAIDQTFSEDIDGGALVGDTATLELSPYEAEVLSLAQATGDIALALRSFADIGLRNEFSESQLPDFLSGGGDDPTRVTMLRNSQESQIRVGGNR